RLHSEIEVAAARLAEFSRIVAGLDGHFLNRVQSGLGNLGLLFPDTVGGVLAFDTNGLSIGGHPVNAHHEVGAEGCTGKKIDYLQGVSNVSQTEAAAGYGQKRKSVGALAG